MKNLKMKQLTPIKIVVSFAVGLTFAAPTLALEFEDEVTPEGRMIFGDGNANGNFTTDRQGSVEIGLRAKIPFVGGVNDNGDGTYTYPLGTIWNFDWSINTDWNDGGSNLDAYTYEMGLDGNPSLLTPYFKFDPIFAFDPNIATAPCADHSFGNNGTTDETDDLIVDILDCFNGNQAASQVAYASYIVDNNVVQNSWRYEFFAAFMGVYNPNIVGNYSVYISTLDGETVVATSEINVLIGLSPDDIVKSFAEHPADDPGESEKIDQITKDNHVDEEPQFKAFTISITNNSGVDGGLDLLNIVDVVPAEFDLDGDYGGGDGVEVTSGACLASGAEHQNRGKDRGREKLQPEIITINTDGLANGDECLITVYVKTDRAHKKTYTPTSCPVTLNDGVKVFNSSMELIMQDDDTLIFDDGSSGQGTCNEFAPDSD